MLPATRNKILLPALVTLVVAFRITMVFLIPFGQKVEHHLEGLNDEPAHFNYVKFLAQHRAFPVLEHWVTEPDAFVRNEFEYHQAPLYYLLCAPFYRLLYERNARLACRILSALFGIASLFFIALLLRDCHCPAPVQWGGVLFAGLLFSHLYFTSLVSNDGSSWLLALMLTCWMARYGISMAVPSRISSIAAAALLSAGALTKSSLLIFFPLVAGVCIYKYYTSKESSHLVRGALIAGIAGLAAAPWYVRNLALYHSLLGTPPAPAYDFLTMHGVVGFVKATVKYFWFPMQHLHGGTPAFFLLCACGSAILAAHAVFALLWAMKLRRKDVAGLFFAAVLLLNVLAYAWYFIQWQNPEARFLFPALGPIIFFMVVPAYQFFIRCGIERFFLPYLLVISIFPYPFLLFAG